MNKLLREQEKKAAAMVVKEKKAAAAAAAEKNAAPPPPPSASAAKPIEKWTHPALSDDTSHDSEYAKFVRSLISNDDAASLYTFKTLHTIKDTTAEDVVGTIVGDDIAYNVLEEDGDDEDYQLLTSDEEDYEDYDDESKAGSSARVCETPHKKVEEEGEFDLHNLLFGEIEGLLEEDLDAQLTSLLQMEIVNENNKPQASLQQQKQVENNASLLLPGQIAVVGTDQQKAITSPGQTTKKKKSTQTVVTTPTFTSPPAKNAMMAQVTKRQLSRLRETMARHHQLLLQQATLAVRAAYVQKVFKDGNRPSHLSRAQNQGGGKVAQGLPARMLNSRQLTFCAPGFSGKDCNYENDFYHGENAEELAECLDGAVGMLQDLEQVSIRCC